MRAAGAPFREAPGGLAEAVRPSPVAGLTAALIIAAWCMSAVALKQSIFSVQRSQALLDLGAANGQLLHGHGWWRLIASQFLHVHAPHMLFNALGVLVVGGFIERRHGWMSLVMIYLVGGCIGQAASVFTYPDLVSSGASQALMALCGAGLIMSLPRSAKALIAVIVAVQIGLDLHAAGTIKVGHWAGFLPGLLIGTAVWKRQATP